MPELPEVETIKIAIEEKIKNALIEKVKINCDKFRIPTQKDFKEKITNTKILSYQRRAKYININLDNGYSIILHLGMSGKIKLFEEKPKEIEKHDHIIIETSNGVIVYNDARRFGLMIYSKTEEIPNHRLFRDLGIEPFDPKLTKEYLFEKIKKKEINIKDLLLNQKIIVGIGNIYASEILFLSKISPLRKSNHVSIKEADIIIKNTKIVLEQAIKAGGSTLKDYQKPDGSLGYFQNLHCVYNKTGRKCMNCDCDIQKTGGIKKIVQNGRSTFYCETKQK